MQVSIDNMILLDQPDEIVLMETINVHQKMLVAMGIQVFSCSTGGAADGFSFIH